MERSWSRRTLTSMVRYSKSCELVSRFFFFSSRRRHTRFDCDWSSDVCSSDLIQHGIPGPNNCRLNTDVSWAEAWPRAVGGATVEGHAYQRDLQFLGLSDVREEIGRASCRERV